MPADITTTITKNGATVTPTAPKLEPVCYRRARVRNESPYTLLPGKEVPMSDPELAASERAEVPEF